MNKVLLQLWEESNTGDPMECLSNRLLRVSDHFLSDGCSLHIDLSSRNNYISTIYGDRSINVSGYDRIVGDYIEVFVTDSLYDLIIEQKTLKLTESSFQNLLKFEDIVYNKSKV